MKYFLAACATFYILLSMGRAYPSESIEGAIRDLSNPNADVQDRAVALLVKHKTESVARLHAEFYFSVNGELKKLSNEIFSVRENATRRLMLIGPDGLKSVRDRLRTDSDPEVTLRCRHILKIAGRGALPPSLALLVQGAARVLLESKADLKARRPLALFKRFLGYKHFLLEKNLPMLRQALQALSGETAAFEVLVRALGRTESSKVFAALSDPILKIDLERALAVLSEYEEHDTFGEIVDEVRSSINLKHLRDDFLEKIKNLKRNVDAPFMQGLDSNENFKNVFRNDVSVFLNSDHLGANALGFKLLEGVQHHDFFSRIIEIIKSIQPGEDSNRIGHYLPKLAIEQKHIIEHLDVLLNCPSDCVFECALEYLDANPEPYFDRLVSRIRFTRPMICKNLVSFLVKHFPSKIEVLSDKVVVEIKKLKSSKEADQAHVLSHLAQSMEALVGIRSHKLDTWWQEQFATVRNPEWKGVLLRYFGNMNISGKLVLPHLHDAQYWESRKNYAVLLNGSLEHRRQAVAFLYEKLRKNKDVYEAMVLSGELIKADSKQFQRYLNLYLNISIAYFKKETKDKQSLNDSRYRDLAQDHLSKHPRDVSLLVNRLKGKDPIDLAFTLALIGEQDLDIAQRKTVIQAFQKVLTGCRDQTLLTYALIPCLYNRLDRNLFYDALLLCYRSDEGKHYVNKYSYLVDSDDPALLNLLKAHFNELSGEGASVAALTMMNINPDCEIAQKHFFEQARSSQNHYQAANAIDILGYFKCLPALSYERLSYLYEDKDYFGSINGALTQSRENALRAQDAILKNLKAMAKTGHSELGDLLWTFPALQPRVASKLVSMLEDGTAEERACASNELATAEKGLAEHVDRLAEIFKQEKDPDIMSNLLWAFANAGQSMSTLAPSIIAQAKSPNVRLKHRAWFALSRISLAKEERLRHVQLLLGAFKKGSGKYRSKIIRMLGLVPEFHSKVHPVLGKVLVDETLEKGLRSQAAWGLARNKPFTSFAVDAYEIIVKNSAASKKKHKMDELINPILWCLRQHPPSTFHMLPMLDTMKLETRMTESFWRTRHALRAADKEIQETKK